MLFLRSYKMPAAASRRYPPPAPPPLAAAAGQTNLYLILYKILWILQAVFGKKYRAG